MKCPQFRNSESSIHFFVVVSANDLAPVLNPLTARYEGRMSITDLRKLEKVLIKVRKAELDSNFLRICQSFGVFTKFICFDLPGITNRQDALAIRKLL